MYNRLSLFCQRSLVPVRIENEFRVDALPGTVWGVLMDMPIVVSCMQGAELTETVDATHWKTKVTVKVGPIALVFAADLEREVADSDTGLIVMTSRARELKGRGAATARVESTLEPMDGGSRVVIVTDVNLSGTAAQFGRPVMQQVSQQLVARFAACLQAKLEPTGATAGDEPSLSPDDPSSGAAEPFSVSILLRALVSPLTRLFRRHR